MDADAEWVGQQLKRGDLEDKWAELIGTLLPHWIASDVTRARIYKITSLSNATNLLSLQSFRYRESRRFLDEQRPIYSS